MSRPKDERPIYQINEERFNRRVHWDTVQDRKRDCWIWISTKFKRRYVTINAGDKIKQLPWMWVREPGGGNRQVYARRFAWEMTWGPIQSGTIIMNVCGEDLCVNPHPEHNRASSRESWRQDLFESQKNAKPVVSTRKTLRSSACQFNEHSSCNEPTCSCPCHKTH